MKSYYIEKVSETSADTLLAVGFATLLSDVQRACKGSTGDIVLKDAGSCYLVETTIELEPADLQNLPPWALIPPLVTDKYVDKYAKQGQKLDGFRYQEQQEISKVFYERLKKLPAQYRRPEALARMADNPIFAGMVPPHKRLGHYQAINQMKIASTFNELAQRWFYLGELQRQHVQILLDLFSEPQNDLEGAVLACQKLAKEHNLKKDVFVTALQIINPTTGKGANYPKASELARAIGNQESFWLLELLKFVGFLDASAPYVLQGSKDRKTYVLQPRVIALNTLKQIMQTFRAVCWSSTAVKLDVLAALRFAQAFVDHRLRVLTGEVEAGDDPFADTPLLNQVRGFEVASYKDLGSAYATMNIATLNLPRWLPDLNTLENAQRASAFLEEHLQLIQRIRSSRKENSEGAEEYALLRTYRDFLSGDDLKPFWTFTTAYSGYYISQREDGKYPQQLTTDGLENLITMNTRTNFSKIVQSEGFQHIATAIRQATVSAQYRRSQLRDRTYDVRYGLGQELMREVHYPDKFIQALSTFLHQYNAETAREEEKVANRLGRALTSQDRRASRLRMSVATTDINELVALIDEFGPEAVCSLLVAYGYARDGRPTNPDAARAEATSADDDDTHDIPNQQ